MNKQRKYFSLKAIITVVLFGGINARAQTTPHVSIQPLHTYIEAPATCTLHLVVDECIDSLSCFECIVMFDTSLASLETIEEGQLYTEAAFPTFFQWEHSAPDTGSVIDCVLGYQSYILPPGELARFIFQAKQTGVCPVKITRMRLWDIDREIMQVEVDSFAYIHNTIATGVHPIGHTEAHLRCYPNPFNPCTSLILNFPYVNGEAIEADISVSIYTPAGRLVRTIHRGVAQSGTNEFTWDGRDWRGTGAPSGVYFAAVIVNGETFVRKLILLR